MTHNTVTPSPMSSRPDYSQAGDPSPRWTQHRSLCGLGVVVLATGLAFLPMARGFGAEFRGEGTVLSLNPEQAMVFLDHDEIAGLMPPMKMGFQVASPELLKGLARGDRVQFTLEAQESAVVITTITRVGGGGSKGAP